MQKERSFQENSIQQILEQNPFQHQAYTNYRAKYANRDITKPLTQKLGRLIQVELVNQCINEIESNTLDGLISVQSHNNMTIQYTASRNKTSSNSNSEICQGKCLAKLYFVASQKQPKSETCLSQCHDTLCFYCLTK